MREELTEDEIKTYSLNRCPTGYIKLGILGKGGCAVVWRCKNIETGLEVAAK